ncbi:unnamed protein product [Mycena citricolor]|uniref:DUF4219 domain-containing protein n=1 Tax=Mycena citricolor TaxID=2018698 RepID=A0AAD2H5C7_9AGAR|nr:unnamed protein product [Mycena citricolor]
MPFDASRKTFDNLRSSPSNYTTWKLNVEAVAKTYKVWRMIQGRVLEPDFLDPNAPTKSEQVEHDEWEDLRDEAAGMLWLCIEPDQQEHVKSVRNNPEMMWDKLAELHRAQSAAPRFSTLINLLNVTREPDKPLMTFLTRITSLGGEWRELLPPTLSLNQLCEELQCIAAIQQHGKAHARRCPPILLHRGQPPNDERRYCGICHEGIVFVEHLIHPLTCLSFLDSRGLIDRQMPVLRS